MTPALLARSRAWNQQITSPEFNRAADVVAWLGAVQAQDFAAGKWAIGLRMPNATDATIEKAIADGSIVRTWALRGTLHFVTARDVRWMLELVAPAMHVRHAGYYRKLALTDAVLRKSQDIMLRVLQGGNQLTRKALLQEIHDGGVSVEGLRANFILLRASLDRILCSGPRQGKEFSFVLFDEWVAPAKPIDREKALETLAKRYFKSHGPATLDDFIWWSGVSRTDARLATDRAKRSLRTHESGDTTYYSANTTTTSVSKDTAVHMLPPFDEHLIGYTDRSAMIDPEFEHKVMGAKNGIFSPILVFDGKVIGTWKRTIHKNTVSVSLMPFAPLTKAQHKAVAQTLKHYATFLGMKPGP